MKQIIQFSAILFLLLFPFGSFGQISFTGIIFSNGTSEKNCKVEIRKDGNLIATQTVNQQGLLLTKFEYNHVYELKFMKEGFLPEFYIFYTTASAVYNNYKITSGEPIYLQNLPDNGGNFSPKFFYKFNEVKRDFDNIPAPPPPPDPIIIGDTLNPDASETENSANNIEKFNQVLDSLAKQQAEFEKNVAASLYISNPLSTLELLDLDTTGNEKITILADSITTLQNRIKEEVATAPDSLNYLSTLVELKEEIITNANTRLELLRKSEITEETIEQMLVIQEVVNSLLTEISIIKTEISEYSTALKERDFRILRQKNTIRYTHITLVFAIVFILILFILYRNKRKSNNILKEKNSLINNQKEEIMTQQSHILEKNAVLNYQQNEIKASLTYAKRIQEALLPSELILKAILPNHFIMFRPRDIVSGDFYWAFHNDNYVYVAAVDCTGHGVPGAFMSILGITFLNEIAVLANETPAEILNELRERVKQALHQTGKDNEAQDGMDIALCRIDKKEKRLLFAGAHNPLYVVRNNVLTKLNAERQPIAIFIRETAFANQSFTLENGDMIYLFSDGYYDQINFNNEGRFKTSRFQNLLTKISNESVKKQKEILEYEHEQWKAGFEQIDDILVIGVRFDV